MRHREREMKSNIKREIKGQRAGKWAGNSQWSHCRLSEKYLKHTHTKTYLSQWDVCLIFECYANNDLCFLDSLTHFIELILIFFLFIIYWCSLLKSISSIQCTWLLIIFPNVVNLVYVFTIIIKPPSHLKQWNRSSVCSLHPSSDETNCVCSVFF